ncbi:MAG: hypothetical protein OES26_27630, partial [Gammaproteobacteria bacterium]|nr:hypothetical protein [Gammaproteobacteria bacterium]
ILAQGWVWTIPLALTPEEKREAARYLMETRQLSITRSCRCVGLHRPSHYRVSLHWAVKGAEVIAVLASLVEGRPSRGLWKCRKLIRRQGRPWNHKRI